MTEASVTGIVNRALAISPGPALTERVMVTYKIPMVLKEYEDDNGRGPFGLWFASLDALAVAKVTVALNKVERGALSNAKSVGGGVTDFGPGYRVYFAMDGQTLVILLIGGTKKRQQRDIDAAKSLWADYKAGKKGKS